MSQTKRKDEKNWLALRGRGCGAGVRIKKKITTGNVLAIILKHSIVLILITVVRYEYLKNIK